MLPHNWHLIFYEQSRVHTYLRDGIYWGSNYQDSVHSSYSTHNTHPSPASWTLTPNDSTSILFDATNIFLVPLPHSSTLVAYEVHTHLMYKICSGAHDIWPRETIGLPVITLILPHKSPPIYIFLCSKLLLHLLPMSVYAMISWVECDSSRVSLETAQLSITTPIVIRRTKYHQRLAGLWPWFHILNCSHSSY